MRVVVLPVDALRVFHSITSCSYIFLELFHINPMASCLNTNTAYYEIGFKSPSISVGGIVTPKK
jgi:hypothetical protein